MGILYRYIGPFAWVSFVSHTIIIIYILYIYIIRWWHRNLSGGNQRVSSSSCLSCDRSHPIESRYRTECFVMTVVQENISRGASESGSYGCWWPDCPVTDNGRCQLFKTLAGNKVPDFKVGTSEQSQAWAMSFSPWYPGCFRNFSNIRVFSIHRGPHGIQAITHIDLNLYSHFNNSQEPQWGKTWAILHALVPHPIESRYKSDVQEYHAVHLGVVQYVTMRLSRDKDQLFK